MASRYRIDNPLAEVIDAHTSINTSVNRILRAARTHLGMDFAFISEFMPEDRIIRHVDFDITPAPIEEGDRLPLKAGYCNRIVQGILPELIPDTSLVPAALTLPETYDLPIGAHIGVPIRFDDGVVYGTFCCFSRLADPSLNQRDLSMMHTLAELIGHQLDADLAGHRQREQLILRLNNAMQKGQPSMVYQPIYGLEDGNIAGVECLSRFEALPRQTPDIWFSEAASVGLGIQLEMLAIRTALAELSSISGDFYIAINTSPQTLFSGQLQTILDHIAPERLVIEITEHDHIENYADVLRALAPLRESGVRVAIDDAGAGYSSMRHILIIQPDLIKLDISLTQNINDDSMRCALASALVEFARRTGSTIIAEGVETAEELDTLYTLGVRRIQGFHLSHPLALTGLTHLLRQRH